jgi:hypothetical protein
MGISQSLTAGAKDRLPQELPGAGFSGSLETSSVLVLAATDNSAVFCSTSNGVSRFLHAASFTARTDIRGKYLDGTPIAKELLARELTGELEKIVRGERYEGIVIFSDKSLHRALCRQVSRRLPHLMVVCVNGLPEALPAPLMPDASARRN